MSKQKPRILVVDDDKVARLKLCHVLERDVGAEVLTADDGEQAWEIFIADESIQFVISDWVMPHCDGPQLCERVRKQPDRPYTYFILATAKSEEQDLVNGLALGADDYVRKPFLGSELQARVKAGLRVIELERSLALRNLELEQALKAASQMQQDMLPNETVLERIKRTSGLAISYSYRACESLGGDVLRLVEPAEGTTMVLLGDVSGHGIPASLASVGLSTFFQAQCAITSDPRELVLRAHGFCTSDFPTGVYATAILLRIDNSRRSVDAVIAGHPPLLLLRKSGSIVKYSGESAPLGLFSEPPNDLNVHTIQMEIGDRVLAYSDGIVETRNSAGDMYTEVRLSQSLSDAGDIPLSHLLDLVLENAAKWRGVSVAEDDITLLALQFESQDQHSQ